MIHKASRAVLDGANAAAERRPATQLLSLALAGALAMAALADLRDEGDLQRRASWQQPTAEELYARVEGWLKESPVDSNLAPRVLALWKPPTEVGKIPAHESGMLDRVLGSFQLAEPRAAPLLALLGTDSPGDPAAFPLLFDPAVPEFVRHNGRLAYGRWLTQHGHFDEALEQLGGLEPRQVVDPAALLFYQAVAYHSLLKKEECLAALGKLLENESRLPRRFATVAKLMESDIRPLETDSLDEVARMMTDVRRRLGFGHAGKKVRDEEDEVIAKLDKKIKQIEEQMQKSPSASQGKASSSPQNPARDSGDFGGKGPGDVDQKRIGSKSGWGNLPPKEREQALQQIGKDLPAHYREAIEEYFRRLAREGGK